jgi:hypothetical protein
MMLERDGLTMSESELASERMKWKRAASYSFNV